MSALNTEITTVAGLYAFVVLMIYGICDAIANRRPNWRRIDARRVRINRNRR